MNLRLLSFDGDWMWKHLGDGVKLFILVRCEKSLFIKCVNQSSLRFLREYLHFYLLFVSKAIRDDVNKFKDSSDQQQVDGEKFPFLLTLQSLTSQANAPSPSPKSDLIIPLSLSPFGNSNDDTMM